MRILVRKNQSHPLLRTHRKNQKKESTLEKGTLFLNSENNFLNKF